MRYQTLLVDGCSWTGLSMSEVSNTAGGWSAVRTGLSMSEVSNTAGGWLQLDWSEHE